MVIKFFATFRKLTCENEAVIPEAVDLQHLLAILCERYGKEFQKKILLPGGQLHHDVIVLINGRAIEHLQGLATALKTSDIISIFPRMAGG